VRLEKKELALSMRVAAALACWRARWKSEGIWGTKSLGLEY